MRLAKYLCFACLLPFVSADESSLLGGLFRWSGGWDYSFWTLGLTDSYVESESQLDVTATQYFVDSNIQHYKDTLEKKGLDLREHFPGLAYIDHWKTSEFNGHEWITLELWNATIDGLSHPSIGAITKIQHYAYETLRIADYYLEVTYPELTLTASYDYRNNRRTSNQSGEEHYNGTFLIHFWGSKFDGNIRVNENENGKPVKIVEVHIKPRAMEAFPMYITGCPSVTTVDATLQTADTASQLIKKNFTNIFVAAVEAKLLRNLNSLIETPSFPFIETLA